METDLLPFLGWVCLCYVLIVFSCVTIILVAACVKYVRKFASVYNREQCREQCCHDPMMAVPGGKKMKTCILNFNHRVSV